MPIVSGATAYKDQGSGETYILVFHESLYYGSNLDHTLVNPNQLQMNGVNFWDNPFDPMHELCIETPCGVKIPLEMNGTKVLFKTHVPSEHELNNCMHIDMTSTLEWNPHTVTLGAVSAHEKAHTYPVRVSKVFTDYRGEHNTYEYTDLDKSEVVLHQIDPTYVCLKN